jgi:hypothetical protein
MANEFARNLQDAAVNPAAFALPSSAGSTQSTGIDLGTDAVKPERVELDLSVAALNSTMVPDTRTVTYVIEASAASNFSTIERTILSHTYTGTGGTGAPAFAKRSRLPADCPRYVRAKITTGSTTGDCSSISATLKALF